MGEMKLSNPILPGRGICDPHIRIFDDIAYLYATHDAAFESDTFVMNDWQIWRSADLANWALAGTLRPEDTFFGQPSNECWAADAMERDGRYYLYFSMGPETIGVVMSDGPAGPWTDPLGVPLIAKGSVGTSARDPAIFQEDDGTSYIVFGTFDFYIARLGNDMISLAEAPHLIEIHDKCGPYGAGLTDDKPSLHRRGEHYYLSWGSYYALGSNPYGPFDCKGSLIKPENVDPPFLARESMKGDPRLRDWLNYDRHGAFFTFKGCDFFACNDQSGSNASPFFRNSILCKVEYSQNGEIFPIQIRSILKL